jgi:CheY-like chemotaxis protein
MKGLFEQNVLVLDDDDEGMRDFIELLEDAGADVVLAATGAEALKRIEAYTVTGAIIAPRVSDAETTRVVDKLFELNIPVVVRTSPVVEPPRQMVMQLTRLLVR